MIFLFLVCNIEFNGPSFFKSYYCNISLKYNYNPLILSSINDFLILAKNVEGGNWGSSFSDFPKICLIS